MLVLLVAVALAAPAPRRAPAADGPPLVVEVQTALDPPPGCVRRLDPVRSAGLPARRADDLAIDTPGLLLTDVLGQGAARAASWRGFPSSPGADVEVTVEGVPAQHAGHPGGEGWTTLGWIPRGLVATVDACEGVTDGGVGPRAMAGSFELGLGLPREGWFAGLTAGTDSSGSIGVAFRPRGWGARTFVAVEAEDGAGVGSDRGWRDLRVVAGLERNLREVHVAALLAFHDAGWHVPPRLRVEDVESGALGFREGYRLWEGGASAQQARLTLAVSRPWTWGGLVVRGWFDAQRLVLSDNLTGFLVDPRRGDGEERVGSSFDSGLRARLRLERPMFGDRSRLEAGFELRGTSGRTALRPVDLELVPLGPDVATQRGWFDAGAWAQGRLALFGRARLEAGFRADHHTLSRAEDTEGGRSWEGGTWSVQPRVQLSGWPGNVARLWAGWSRGARPPRADDLVDGEVVAPQVDTVDGGLALVFLPRVEARVAVFAAFGRDEFVLDPISGELLGRGATRRLGGTAELDVRPIPGVRVRLDGAFADARWTSGELLPHTVPGRVGVGLYADERALGPVVLTGGLRFAWYPPRTTTGGVVSGGIATLDARARIAWKRWWFDLAVDNLAPWDWWGVEAAWASRWDPDAPAVTTPVRHGIAGRPFALVLGVGAWF